VQGVAFLPGVSRLALTYVAGRWLKLSNKKAFEISFLVHWPLMLASFLNTVVVRAMYKDVSSLEMLLRPQTLLVFACAGVVAFFALWFTWWVVGKKKMWMFSLYLLVPGFATLTLVNTPVRTHHERDLCLPNKTVKNCDQYKN